MSESLHLPEHQEVQVFSPEQHPALPEHAEAPKPGNHEVTVQNQLEQARRSVEQTVGQDNPIERLEAAEKAAEPAQPRFIKKELRRITLRREIQHVQRKLSLPDRTLSRLIHQPVVRQVSEAAAKSVSRPSGLLGGGLMAFLGTSSYLYLAKHLGFSYNYLVFLMLFGGGFLIGIGLELLVHLATASHRQSSD